MTDDVPNPSSKNRTVCWLIEHQNGGWLHGNPEHEDGFGWSPDPNRAIRFCRQIDAEWTMARLGFSNPLHFASEHVFISDDSPPAHETGVREVGDAVECVLQVEIASDTPDKVHRCRTELSALLLNLPARHDVRIISNQLVTGSAEETKAPRESDWHCVHCGRDNDPSETHCVQCEWSRKHTIAGVLHERGCFDHPCICGAQKASEQECRRAGLSEHAAGTGTGDTRAEARSSRREVTAWPKCEEPDCDNPADPHEAFCRDHK